MREIILEEFELIEALERFPDLGDYINEVREWGKRWCKEQGIIIYDRWSTLGELLYDFERLMYFSKGYDITDFKPLDYITYEYIGNKGEMRRAIVTDIHSYPAYLPSSEDVQEMESHEKE